MRAWRCSIERAGEMSRAPRRISEIDPAVITARGALYYEESRAWPPGEARRFWNGSGVPERLRPSAEPDPRRVLGTEEQRLEYASDLALWKARRIEWLEEQVSRG